MSDSTRVITCECCGVPNLKLDLIIVTSELFKCPNCNTEIKIRTEEN